MATARRWDSADARAHPIVNTHVHLPPNFSAFETPEAAIEAARVEGVRVIGVSNFHDLRVYGRFADAARDAGMLPLFSIELIAVVDDLRDAGVRVNDPANPGRMYVCGKGVDPFATPSAEVSRIGRTARTADEARAREMANRLRRHFADAGVPTSLDDAAIIGQVAERARVPAAWVVLQERHLAMAFQEALFRHVAPNRRAEVLARVYNGQAAAATDDPGAVQDEIRSRLMKVGGPAFIEEAQLSLQDALQLVLGWGGIPTYPTLADGASPICAFEHPADELVARLKGLGVHMAELIPSRNNPEVVDTYVRAFRRAGIAVMAGTEHNTFDPIPFDPACRGGRSLSAEARDAFWEGTCVVAAHQERRRQGLSGFVDQLGIPAPGFPDADARIWWFAELGAGLIARDTVAA